MVTAHGAAVKVDPRRPVGSNSFLTGPMERLLIQLGSHVQKYTTPYRPLRQHRPHHTLSSCVAHRTLSPLTHKPSLLNTQVLDLATTSDEVRAFVLKYPIE